jgi:PAS domain S-box-containing protein
MSAHDDPRPDLATTLFESVPDALVVVDGTGRIAMANANAERLFGYARGAMNGLEIEALMPSSVRARHIQSRDGYMAAPRVRPMGGTGQALIGQRLGGEQFPVEIALSPLPGSDGPRFLASVRDISETQRARQALVRARYDALVARIGQRALESPDGSDVIESLPLHLAETLDVDAVALVLLHGPRSGAEGRDLEVRAAHGFEPDLLEAALEGDSEFGRALVGGRQAVLGELGATSDAVAALPGLAGGSAALVPLLDRERPMGALVALSRQARRFDHDALHLLGSMANMLAALLQRRQTEEQLAHSQRLDAVGQLTGGIAHDFNNLLTIISGSLQLLELELTPGQHADADALIASALRSVTRGAELTTKLLAFARRQRLTPAPVDPVALLRDLETMLRRTLGESIQLRVQLPGSLPAALADATQLDTALVNLSLNARDAMPRGGEITLSVREQAVADGEDGLAAGRYVVFAVEDTGHGMGPETLARAVDPFFTTKEGGRGSGLGLSMVYGFARQSGGGLRIDSRLGYGTRVELFLPVSREAATAAAANVPAARQGEGRTVLVVEDEPDVRAIAEAFLRSLGFATRAVGDAAQALALLREGAVVDLLFSDVMLGEGMDGYALAHAARALRPQLPVLLASGYNETAARSGELPFELLRKPYRREQLAEAVQRQLHAPPAPG